MPSPLVVATVTAATMADLRRQRDAVAGADLVELRLDGVEDLDVAGALAGARLPVVATCRPAWERGAFRGSEEERLTILDAALGHGAAYVDVEWRAGFDELVSRHPRRIVLSMHDFEGVPSDLGQRARAMRAAGTALVKIAVRASSLTDCLRLAVVDAGRSGGVVRVAMDQAGFPVRLLPARFGSCWTYAGDAAPGQLPLPRVLDEFRFRSVGSATALYGVVGSPIGHSLSPAMHNACFAALGIDAVYVPLQAASVEDFLVFAEAVGLSGASVTAPFKTGLAARVNVVDPVAQRLGSINTIGRRNGTWAGINTDVEGFLEPLLRAATSRAVGKPGANGTGHGHALPAIRGCRAAIVGAGGAARSAAAALSQAGALVSVYGRSGPRAEAVAALAGGHARTGLPAPSSWDLLVNATPVGTWPNVNDTPVPSDLLRGGLVYDLVSSPPETRLLREAAAAGCATIGGLDMLIAQARRQFAWWTGQVAPPGVMRRAALACLAGRGAA